MTWTAEERETTIGMDDASGVVRIWTAQRSVITQLSRRPDFRLIDQGEHQGQPWARFEIDKADWTPWSGVRRKVVLTEAQRAERAQRLNARRVNVAS